jgi:uncharacterized membrane protein YraQ (UPF0718 family)
MNKKWKKYFYITGVFFVIYYLPVDNSRFNNALLEALKLVKWYANEHVLLCLLPAFLIAGAVSVFINQNSVIKYLGFNAKKTVSYSVAAVSGSVLSVCSCTVLPLFAGIYRMGAGIGPASAFLYSGPAVNILAVILTGRILGMKLGIARAAGAVSFSIIIGLVMQLIFRKETSGARDQRMSVPQENQNERPIHQTIIYFALLIAILVFANWGKPSSDTGLWYLIYSSKWIITSLLSVLLAAVLVLWFNLGWFKVVIASLPAVSVSLIFRGNPEAAFGAGLLGLSVLIALDKNGNDKWFSSSISFAEQIMPLLLAGVLLAGFFLGRPGHEGIIPSEWVYRAVGGNSVRANFTASVAGAFMYFATLTEVPILQGLMANGMGQGPALALLLAGPALSLPNMLVIRSIMGTKKTAVFVALVIVMAALSGIIFGKYF